MAILTYPKINTEYHVEDLIRDRKIIGNKILIGNNAYKVSTPATPNMSVNVATGIAYNQGYSIYNSSNVNLTIASNTASYPRIDAIIINNNTEVKVIQGSPAASPVCPSCTGTNQIKLAEVYVGNAVTSIQASNVKDCRKITKGQRIINNLAEELYNLENKITSLESNRIIKYDYTSNPSYEVWSTGKKIVTVSGIINQSSGAFDHTANFYADCGIEFTNPQAAVITFHYNSKNAWNTRQASAIMYDGKSVRMVIPALGAYTGVYRCRIEGI